MIILALQSQQCSIMKRVNLTKQSNNAIHMAIMILNGMKRVIVYTVGQNRHGFKKRNI